VSTQRYLKKSKGDGFVHIYTPVLAARGDMVECDAKGRFVADVQQEAKEPFPEAASKVDLTKVELVAIATERFKVNVSEDTPTAAIVDAILSAYEQEQAEKPEVEKMTKAQLIAYAKEKFGVDIEDSLKVGEIREQIKTLSETTGGGS
jgi:hypothetical protein